MSLDDFPSYFRDHYPGLIGRSVAVALSGGADSVALLHLLREPNLRVKVLAIHVHHGARGAEADRDAEFCRRLCHELDVPFRLVRLETDMNLAEGREAAWRRARYDALSDAAGEMAAEAIATAHHRDDVAEGVMVQLLRGAGPRALAGIADTTERGVVRPLLAWRRTEVRTWLENRGLRWCEDSSNQNPEHLRNLVREKLLPDLELASPRLRDHLVRLAGALAADDALLSDELKKTARWIDPWHPDGGVPIGTVRDLPLPLRTRWLHAQLALTGIGRVTTRQLEVFEELLDSGRPRAVSLAGRWNLRSARGRLWLEPPADPAPTTLRLTPGGEMPLGVPGWSIRVADEAMDEPRVEWRTQVSADDDLGVRGVAKADFVAIDGKIVAASRLLAAQLPRHLRHAWPAVTVGDTIAWIPGVWQHESGGRPGGVVVEVVRR